MTQPTPKPIAFLIGVFLLGILCTQGAPPLGRAELAAARKAQNPGGKFYEHMDLGPVFTGTIADGVEGPTLALKGLAVSLDATNSYSILYDTETLGCKAGGAGFVLPSGTPWDGRHSGTPRLASEGSARIWTNPSTSPGWAKGDNLDDPRAVPHGPLPRDWARFLGHYRADGKVAIHYQVGDTEVLEHPALALGQTSPLVLRHFNLAPRTASLTAILLDPLPANYKILDAGQRAVPAPEGSAASQESLATNITVLTDKTLGDWSELATGGLQPGSLKPTISYITGPNLATPHSRAGAKDLTLPRLTDGLLPTNDDDTKNVTWFEAQSRARLTCDLGSAIDLQRIDTYSWHKSSRAPQRYKLWAASGDALPPFSKKTMDDGTWTLLADVDTQDLGSGGKHLSVIHGPLGTHRYLQWEALEIGKSKQGSFYAEISIFPKGTPLQPLEIPAAQRPAKPASFQLIDAPEGVVLKPIGDRLCLHIPAGTSPIAFALGMSSDPDCTATGIRGDMDLAPLKHGGPAQWPETVDLKGSLGATNEVYATDTIPVPVDNPFFSNIRFGAFDFFADGKSGAASTWNGDVWRFDGVDEGLEKITWRRVANGLFQPLGLRIVNEVIHVQGRDGITQLFDLNGDHEIDHYLCLNNDIHITRNFHEFSFDLQTDAAGNFYYSKGAPVQKGGRGFQDIVKHHGTVIKISPDGKRFETVGSGLRAPGGVGVGPNGEITTGENEGSFVPRCKITWNSGKTFNGVVPTAHMATEPTDYDRPLCWLPYYIDNSSGSQVWVPDNNAWSADHAGELLHLSYGKCSLFRVLKEEVNGQIQGGIYRLPARLSSSAMRGRFNPVDGQLYLIGFKGWQTTASRDCGFHRIRATGNRAVLPTALEARANGVLIRFNTPLDPSSANDPDSWAVSKWNYIWGPMYGSGRFSIDNPDAEAEAKALLEPSKSYSKIDRLSLRSISLLDGGHAAFLELDPMTSAMQMEIKCQAMTADGRPANVEIYNTIHNLGPAHELAANAARFEAKESNPTDPGLLLTFSTDQDARVAPRAALYVKEKTPPGSQMKGGPFTATWTGQLQLDERQNLAFHLHGNGSSKLALDGKDVVLDSTNTYGSGAHDFVLSYTSPDKGDAQIKLLWSSATFIAEPVPASAFRHIPNDLLARKTYARTHYQDIRSSRGYAEYAESFILKQDCRACHNPVSKNPDLDSAGEKLTTDWMVRFFEGKLDQKTRPWAGECDVGTIPDPHALALGLAALHGNGPSERTPEDVGADALKYGTALSAPTAYACNTCHAIKDKPAVQVFEGAGPNLSLATDRLRYEYYQRWMHNPQRLSPGSIMPRYTIDRDNTAREDILGGKANAQFDAIWKFLDHSR